DQPPPAGQHAAAVQLEQRRQHHAPAQVPGRAVQDEDDGLFRERARGGLRGRHGRTVRERRDAGTRGAGGHAGTVRPCHDRYMSEQTTPEPVPDETPAPTRALWAERQGGPQYIARNGRGAEVRIGSGDTEGVFSPGELLKVALAACTAL